MGSTRDEDNKDEQFRFIQVINLGEILLYIFPEYDAIKLYE